MRGGRFEGLGRRDPRDAVAVVARHQDQQFARGAAHLEVQRTPEADGVACERLAQPPLQFRVAGFPDLVPRPDAAEINVTLPEREHDFPRPASVRPPNCVNPAALLGFVRPTGVEHHAVAGLKRAFEPDAHAGGGDVPDLAQEHAALFGEARVDQRLVVDAPEPARVQPARKGHLHLVQPFRKRGGRGCVPARRHGIQRLAVNPGDAGDVLRGLQPAFDLERRHAQPHQIGDHLDAREVLRAEQVTAVAQRHGAAIGHQLVRQAAGLRAFAAVGRAAAEGFAGQALARVGHAQRAVDKDLQR